jgi:hypothetical protein
VAGTLALVVGCGIGIGRDLRMVPPQQVIYDDVCRVQEYFDKVEAKQAQPLTILNSSDFTRESASDPAGGITTFGFQSEAELTLLRRVLGENWKNLPKELLAANKVEVRVKWAEKAGVRRVVTDEDAIIAFDGKTSYLPYHICLSELFFGAPLYKTRRELLGIALPEVAAAADAAAPLPPEGLDAGSSPDVTLAH